MNLESTSGHVVFVVYLYECSGMQKSLYGKSVITQAGLNKVCVAAVCIVTSSRVSKQLTRLQHEV